MLGTTPPVPPALVLPLGYNLVLSHLLIVFFLFLYRLSVNTSNLYAVIMLLIFTHDLLYDFWN
jgi:hypothetical protein